MGREIWLEGISTRILFFRIIVWEIAARSTTGLIEINVVKKKKKGEIKKKRGEKSVIQLMSNNVVAASSGFQTISIRDVMLISLLINCVE